MAEHANRYLTSHTRVSQGAQDRYRKIFATVLGPSPESVAQPFVACHKQSSQLLAIRHQLRPARTATAFAETPKRSSRALTSSESSRTVIFSMVSINSSRFTAISSPPDSTYVLQSGVLLLLGDLV